MLDVVLFIFRQTKQHGVLPSTSLVGFQCMVLVYIEHKQYLTIAKWKTYVGRKELVNRLILSGKIGHGKTHRDFMSEKNLMSEKTYMYIFPLV